MSGPSREQGELAELVRRHRLAAGLTQESLADLTGLSVRALRDLESGRVRQPRQASADLLITTLGLDASRVRRLVTDGPDDAVPASHLVNKLPAPGLPAVGLIGREEAVAQVSTQLLSRPGLVLGICGLAGVGKTSVAAGVAERVREHVEDVVWLGLRGHGRPRGPVESLRALIGGLSASLPATDDVDALRARWTNLCAERHVLVVLDDAADEEHVHPLVPACGSFSLLITSRRSLTVVDPSGLVVLEPLTPAAGRQLLLASVGTARVTQEAEAADAVIAFCAGLPLALHVASSRLAARPHWSVGDLAVRLTDESERLDELKVGDLDVRATLAMAYAGLTGDARQLLRLMSRLGLPELPIWLVEPLYGHGRRPFLAALDELARDGLVDIMGSVGARGEQVRLHDLVRLTASEMPDEGIDGQTTAALGRAVDAIRKTAAEVDAVLAAEWGSPGGPAWVEHVASGPTGVEAHAGAALERSVLHRLTADEAAVVSVLEQALDTLEPGLVWPVVVAIAAHQQIHCQFTDWISLHRHTLQHLPTGDHVARTVLATSLAAALLATGEVLAAREAYGEAGKQAGAAGLGASQRFALLGELVASSYLSDRPDDELLAASYVLFETARDHGESRTVVESALVIARLEGLAGRRAEAIHVLEVAADCAAPLPQIVAARLGHQSGEQRMTLAGTASQQRAEQELQEAERIFSERGWAVWSAAVLRSLAKVKAASGRPREALRDLAECARMFDEVGDDRWVAYVRISAAEVHLSLGEVGDARAALAAARPALERAVDERGLALVQRLEQDERLRQQTPALIRGSAPARGVNR